MSKTPPTLISFNRWQREREQGQARGSLTSAHRAVMARIQDLCIDVSQQTKFYASCDYAGHVHSLSVELRTYEAREQDDYRSIWTSGSIYLPPSPNSDDDCHQQLAAVVEHLEGLLEQPGGAA